MLIVTRLRSLGSSKVRCLLSEIEVQRSILGIRSHKNTRGWVPHSNNTLWSACNRAWDWCIPSICKQNKFPEALICQYESTHRLHISLHVSKSYTVITTSKLQVTHLVSYSSRVTRLIRKLTIVVKWTTSSTEQLLSHNGVNKQNSTYNSTIIFKFMMEKQTLQ